MLNQVKTVFQKRIENVKEHYKSELEKLRNKVLQIRKEFKIKKYIYISEKNNQEQP